MLAIELAGLRYLHREVAKRNTKHWFCVSVLCVAAEFSLARSPRCPYTVIIALSVLAPGVVLDVPCAFTQPMSRTPRIATARGYYPEHLCTTSYERSCTTTSQLLSYSHRQTVLLDRSYSPGRGQMTRLNIQDTAAAQDVFARTLQEQQPDTHSARTSGRQ